MFLPVLTHQRATLTAQLMRQFFKEVRYSSETVPKLSDHSGRSPRPQRPAAADGHEETTHDRGQAGGIEEREMSVLSQSRLYFRVEISPSPLTRYRGDTFAAALVPKTGPRLAQLRGGLD